jgi:hypothetical protein
MNIWKQRLSVLAVVCPNAPFGWFFMPYDIASWWRKAVFLNPLCHDSDLQRIIVDAV